MTGAAPASCSISDDLAGSAFQLLTLPPPSIRLGGLGGLIGQALATSRPPAGPAARHVEVAPLLVSAALLLLLASEAGFNVW